MMDMKTVLNDFKEMEGRDESSREALAQIVLRYFNDEWEEAFWSFTDFLLKEDGVGEVNRWIRAAKRGELSY